MRSITFATFMLMAFAGSAQNVFGVKAGLNLTNMDEKDFGANMHWRKGVAAGISFERFLGEKESIGADLLFSQRGFRNTVQFNGGVGSSFSQQDVKFNFNYLSLPIKTSHWFGENGPAFISAGVVPSLLINARGKGDGLTTGGQTGGDTDEDFTSDIKKFDLAAQGELGIRYPVGETYSWFASVAFQYSFTSVTTDKFNPNSELRHYGLTISGGITMKR